MNNPLNNIITDGGYTSIFRTIGVVGDSLSSGEFESHMNGETGWWDYYEYSWGQFIARKCGSTVYNFSRGGLTAKTFFTELMPYMENKAFKKEYACQAYIIALGVNDAHRLGQYSLGFGSLSDIDYENPDNNKDSFIGWYAKIIEKLREVSPESRIFLVTTPNETNFGEVEAKYYPLIRDFIMEVSEKFNYTYVINLFDNITYDEKFKDFYYLAGHMNPLGYKYTADIISTYIDYIIRNNIDDFKQVGFINKGIHNDNYKW